MLLCVCLCSSDLKRESAAAGELTEIREEAEEDVDAMRDEAGSEIVPSARESQHSAASMPVITSEQYNQYVRSLIKLMVGETTTFEWVKRGQSMSISFSRFCRLQTYKSGFYPCLQ